jgi:hypothetical protein
MSASEGPEREKTVKEINNTRDALRDSFVRDAKNIKQNMFNFLDGVSILLTAYYKSDGLEGWTSGVEFSDGRGLSAEDGKYIESIFAENARLLDILKSGDAAAAATDVQEGGAGRLTLKKPSFMSAKSAAKGIISADEDTGFDFSIDRGVKKVGEYNTMIDNQVRSITDQIGPTAFISSLPTDPFVPNPLFPPFGIGPPKFQIPKYSILPFLDAVLETLRLTTIFMPFDIPAFRKIASITKAIFELADGNWRQAILSFVGYFGQTAGRMSSIAKIIMQAWMMIDPSVSSKIALYTYKGIKSMFITFWLWVFHLVSPDYVWIPIGKFLDSVNGLLDSSQSGVDKLSETFTTQLQAMGYDGYSVTLPTIEQMIGLPDAGGAPIRFTFDDLQNIQALITMPFFLCSKEGQTIIQQFVKTPVRLVLEILNIPTLPEDVADMCGQSDPGQMKSLAVSVAENMVKGTHVRGPDGSVLAGGLARLPRSTSRKRRGNKKQKKTRRRS